MKQNRALLEQNEKLSLELGEVTEKVVQGVNQILEERALQTNSVTPQSMETMLNGLVERILPGLHDFNMQRPDQQNVEVAPEIP